MIEIRSFASGVHGSVATMFALLVPCLLGAAGLAVETGYWYSEKKRIQIASDVAAYSAVVAYSGGDNIADAIAIGVSQARGSGFTGADADIRIQIPSPESLGPYSATAHIDQDVPLFFAKLFMNSGELLVSVDAHASVDKESASVCLLGLNTTQSRSLIVAADTRVELGSCVVASNSEANDSIWLEGGSTRLTADCVSTPGQVGRNGGSQLSLTECDVADHPREPVADYLAGSSPFWGDASVPDTSVFVDASISQGRYGPDMPGGNTLRPGKYGKQVEIAGPVTFAPGIYYFTNGFRATSGGKITGKGVTFYFDHSKILDVAQSVAWDLTAPTGGPTPGLALMGKPGVTNNVRLIGVIGNVEGAIYFPKSTFQTESGPNRSPPVCTKLIADKIDIRGSGSIKADCSSSSSGASGAKGIVRLMRGSSA